MSEYDVNFGQNFNLTVEIDDDVLEAIWDDIVEWSYDGEPPKKIKEADRLKEIFTKWAEEELECEEFQTPSATFRVFPLECTSASILS